MLRTTAILLPFSVLLTSSGCADKSATPDPAPAAASAAVVEAATPPVIVKIDREATARESSAIVLGRVGGALHAFVADEDDAAIVELDLETDSTVRSTAIGTRPRDLLLLADGRLAATLPDAGAVAIFSRDPAGELHESVRSKSAAEPIAMALDPSDSTLYVSTGASHSLLAFSIQKAALEDRARYSLGREPRAVLVTSDGARAMVTHASESFVSIVSLADGGEQTIATRDIGNRTMCREGGHCSGARVARGAEAIVRVGDRGVVVPATQALPVPGQGFTKSYACPPPRSVGRSESRRRILAAGEVTGYGIGTGESGPPITFDLETLDGKDGSRYGIGTPAFGRPACLLPRAAVAAGEDVLVACLGASRIARYRGTKGSPGGTYVMTGWGKPTFDFGAKIAPTRDGFAEGTTANVSMDAISVPSGPSGIAVDRDHTHAVVWSSFARRVTRIDLDSTPAKTGASIEVPRHIARDEAWLAGRTLFFSNDDKRISTDGRACANCHIDGRDDGLTWKTPMGMRRTRLLAGQTTTGPFGWKGDNATLADHLKRTITNLEGTALPEAELSQLATFVSSVGQPPPASTSTGDREIEHGREVFAAAECAGCHTSGASDRTVHDVGTGGGFVTPTLAGVAMRQQLMHDGRYHTLDELLAGASSMGRGATLSADDRKALLKYLATL